MCVQLGAIGQPGVVALLNVATESNTEIVDALVWERFWIPVNVRGGLDNKNNAIVSHVKILCCIGMVKSPKETT